MDEKRKHPQKPKSRVFSQNRAAGAKTLVVVATILLCASTAVFTYLVLTKAEVWLAERSGLGSYSSTAGSAAVNQNTSAGDDYDNRPIAETNYSEMTLRIVTDDPPPQQSLAQIAEPIPAPALEPQTSTQRQPSTPRPAYTAQRPFDPKSLQNTTLNSPRSPAGTPFMIDNASPNIRYCAITFDGGSYADAAAEIFDTLASRGVKSTLFVTGGFIRRFPQVITRAAQEGHEVGNHMQTHPRLTTYTTTQTQATRPGVTRQFVINELENAARTLSDRTGLRFAPLWRAPYGEYNRNICEWALEAGYIHIGWRQGGGWGRNLDTNDWIPNEDSPGYRTPQEVYDKIVHIAKQPGGLNGGIILMHLGTERKARDQRVHIILGRLIDTLRDLGYEPVTVSELLERSGVDIGAVAF